MGFIWRTVAVCLFLCVAVNADFLDLFSTYRSQIKMRLGFATSTTALSDTLLNTAIRHAVVQVNNEVGGYRVIRQILTTPFAYSYALDSTIAPENVSIRRYDTLKSLQFQPRAAWSTLEHKATTGQTAPLLKRPSYYDFIDGRLLIYPPPFLIDTLEVVAIQRVRGLDTLTTLTQIPERYRPLIFLYAAQFVAQARQHPMTPVLQQEYEAAKQKIVGGANAAKATGTR